MSGWPPSAPTRPTWPAHLHGWLAMGAVCVLYGHRGSSWLLFHARPVFIGAARWHLDDDSEPCRRVSGHQRHRWLLLGQGLTPTHCLFGGDCLPDRRRYWAHSCCQRPILTCRRRVCRSTGSGRSSSRRIRRHGCRSDRACTSALHLRLVSRVIPQRRRIASITAAPMSVSVKALDPSLSTWRISRYMNDRTFRAACWRCMPLRRARAPRACELSIDSSNAAPALVGGSRQVGYDRTRMRRS